MADFLAAKNINRIEWPGNSPNLKPIENCWATMKRKLQEMDVSTRPKMINAIKKVWREVDLSKLKNLAVSMPRWIRELLDREGSSTK